MECFVDVALYLVKVVFQDFIEIYQPVVDVFALINVYSDFSDFIGFNKAAVMLW